MDVIYRCMILTQVTVDQLASMSEITTMANEILTINVSGDVSDCLALGSGMICLNGFINPLSVNLVQACSASFCVY